MWIMIVGEVKILGTRACMQVSMSSTFFFVVSMNFLGWNCQGASS